MKRKKRNKLTIIAFIIILVLGPMVYFGLIKPHKSIAAWFNDSWGYRKAVNISNSSGSALTDFQVSIGIGTSALISSGKMKSDCSDIRITDTNGKLLPHWIEGPCNTAANNATVWTKVPSLPTSGGTVYIYYGNPSAKNVENPQNVFLLFDDFSKVDTDKWRDTTGTNTIISDGYDSKALTTSADANDIRYYSKSIFSGGYAIKARMKEDSTDGGLFFDVQDDSNGYLITSRRGGGTAAFQWYKRASASWSSLSTHTSVNSWTNTEYRTLEVSRVGTSIITKDNESAISYTTSTDSTYSSGSVGIRGSSQQTIDWFFVRKAVSTDPSASSGQEEQSKAPVAYWKFDEGTGSTAFDAANRNNGTLGTGSSAPTWQTEDMCVSGKCLKFDGNDYVNSGSNSSLNFGTGNFSVGGWFKAKPGNTTRAIASKSPPGSGIWWRIQIPTDGTLNFQFDDDIVKYSWTSTSRVDDNNWHYFSITRGSTYEIYIDGKSQNASGTINAGTLSNSGNILIGGDTLNNFYFDGFLDEVKIYPYARTAAEIKTDYNAGKGKAGTAKGVAVHLGGGGDSSEVGGFSQGLVGYWNFDVGTGTSAPDLSGNLNTAVLGTGNSAPGWVAGMYGIGVSFDGGGDYVDLGNNSSLNMGNAGSYSIQLWLKKTGSFKSYDEILSKKLTIGRIHFLIDGNGKLWRWGSSSTFAGPTLSLNQWTHVIYTYSANGSNNGTEKFYINGIETNTRTGGMLSWETSNNFWLGSFNGYWWPFEGLMDELRIYNRALSPTEVRQLYNWAPGPVGYWNMDEGNWTNNCSTATVMDSSGNGNNGVSCPNGTGPTGGAVGKFGKAGSFDGTEDYVNLGNPSSFPNGTSARTMCGWAKTNSVSSGNRWIAAYGNSVGSQAMFIGRVGTTLYGGGYADDITALNFWTTGVWKHICLVYDGANATLYGNGLIVAGPTAKTWNLVRNKAYIGRQVNGLEYWDGLIDDVKIYNYARTPKQIVEDMNAGHPAGGSPVGSAVAHYEFDEGYGTTVNNSGNGGSSLNGALGAGTSAPTWSQNGKFGKALSFDGNDYVSKSDTDTLTFGNGTTDRPFSISSWVNYSSSGGTIISKWGNNQAEWRLRISAGKLQFFIYDQSAVGYIGREHSTILPTNSWHHLVSTYDGSSSTSGIRLFIDGIRVDNNNLSGGGTYIAMENCTAAVNVGDEAVGSTFITGLIDEVKIYSYALTENEINLDYNRGAALVLGSLSSGTGNTAPSGSAGQEYCIPGDTSTCSPPIGRWDFNEGVGSSAFDTSGNGNNGGLGAGTAAPVWTTGKIGKALSFDGSNDYVDAGSNSSFDGFTALTYSAWIKLDTYPATYFKFLARRNGSYFTFFGIKDNAGTKMVYAGVGNGVVNNYVTSDVYTPTLGVWHHIVFTYKNSTKNALIYVDGVERINDVLDNDIPSMSGRKTIIGASQDSGDTLGSFTDGSIDQVQIFNYARSPAQIAWDYNRGAPVAHWKFDECEGVVAHDSAAASDAVRNTGSINIGASGTQTTAGTCSVGTGTTAAWGNGSVGKYNSSLNFDGTDDYMSVADNSNLSFTTGGMSGSAWIKTNSITSKVIFSKDSVTDREYTFYFDSTNDLRAIIFDDSTNGSISRKYTTDIPTGSWHHVAFSYDGTTSATGIKIYLDGIQVDNTDASSGTYVAMENLSAPFAIGGDTRSPTPGQPFDGQIDDVRVFNYALTATQIKNEYNQGSAIRFGPVTGSP